MRPVGCASRPSPSRFRPNYVPSSVVTRDKNKKNNQSQ